MFTLKKKDKGLAPAFVVAILMLCAVVVSYITYRVSLNVSGYSVDGTYDAYETLTGQKINKNNIENIVGGTGSFDSADMGKNTEKGSSTNTNDIYRVYIQFYDDGLEFVYPFENGKTRLCITYEGTSPWQTYGDFLKDDVAHPTFDFEDGSDGLGSLRLDDRELSIVEYMETVSMDGDYNWSEISPSTSIVWYSDGNEYFTELIVGTEVSLREGENVYAITINHYNPVLDIENRLEYTTITTKEFNDYESIKRATNFGLSDDYASFRYPNGSTSDISWIEFCVGDEDEWRDGSPEYMQQYTPITREYSHNGRSITYIAFWAEIEGDNYYITADGEIYTDNFPNTPQMGDKYYCGDYEYLYKGEYYTYGVIYSWTDESYEGWAARVRDDSKTEYEEMLTEICGEPVSNLRATFAYCYNLEAAPKIPEAATTLCEAFVDCENLVSVGRIPDGVQNMDSAFSGCTSLKTVQNLPSATEELWGTFSGCTSLTVAPEIPNGVVGLPSAFYGCASLVETPKLPNGMLDLNRAFYGCTALKRITNIPSSVNSLTSAFAGCSSLVDVPSLANLSVTFLNSTFEGCKSLISTPILPSTVTSLSDTFVDCTSLKYITMFPSGLSSLSGTFENCTSLTDIPNFPDRLTSLYHTFKGCSSLQNIPSIPSGVANMNYAFKDCISLTKAPVLPSNLKYLEGTFYGCTSIVVAPEIPASVTDMRYSFYGCSSLKTVPEFPDRRQVLTMNYAYTNCTSLESFPTIKYAMNGGMISTFAGCTSLTGDIEFDTLPVNYSNCFKDTTKHIFLVKENATSSEKTWLQEIAATGNNGNVQTYG